MKFGHDMNVLKITPQLKYAKCQIWINIKLTSGRMLRLS